MNSQLAFFMTEADEDTFVNSFADVTFDRTSNIQWFSSSDRQGVQLLRCKQCEQVITIGRISVRTRSGTSVEKASEKLYRRMVRYFKKEYSNGLQCRNVNLEGTTGPERRVWVGPDAERLARNGFRLAQTMTGPIVFEMES